MCDASKNVILIFEIGVFQLVTEGSCKYTVRFVFQNGLRLLYVFIYSEISDFCKILV